ncbi:MAG: hypothetical protein ACAI35_12570 [Candidatus Methylacidiphilales bacterium]|nr:hypothetical protein [Candidatus Methylacidiphilales bacterium]
MHTPTLPFKGLVVDSILTFMNHASLYIYFSSEENYDRDGRQGIEFDIARVKERLEIHFPGILFEDEDFRERTLKFMVERSATDCIRIARRDQLESGPSFPFNIPALHVKGVIGRYRLGFLLKDGEGFSDNVPARINLFLNSLYIEEPKWSRLTDSNHHSIHLDLFSGRKGRVDDTDGLNQGLQFDVPRLLQRLQDWFQPYVIFNDQDVFARTVAFRDIDTSSGFIFGLPGQRATGFINKRSLRFTSDAEDFGEEAQAQILEFFKSFGLMPVEWEEPGDDPERFEDSKP